MQTTTTCSSLIIIIHKKKQRSLCFPKQVISFELIASVTGFYWRVKCFILDNQKEGILHNLIYFCFEHIKANDCRTKREQKALLFYNIGKH